MAYIFEWDPQKAVANLRQHGVSFDEATEVFGDPLAVNMPDPDHSIGQERFLLLGLCSRGRLLVVSYAERGTRTRLISVRIASRSERRQYEEELP